MEIEFVLFDLYGTLVDINVDQESPDFWEALAQNLEKRGVRAGAPHLRETFFDSLSHERSRLPDGFVMEKVLEDILQRLDGVPSREEVEVFAGIFRRLSVVELSLRGYTEPLLEALRRSGCKTGIVSNTEAILTRVDLRRLPQLGDVDVTVLSSDVGAKKPGPRIFQFALERLGARAETGIFVGDNFQEDVIGASSLGIRAVYLQNDGEPQECVSLAVPSVAVAKPNLMSLGAALQSLGWQGSV